MQYHAIIQNGTIPNAGPSIPNITRSGVGI